MANERLRAALAAAELTPEQLAAGLAVDERTVRRWLAGQTPYARHRAKLARALELSPHDLWPHLAPTADPSETIDPVDESVLPLVAESVDASVDAPRRHRLSTDPLFDQARHQLDLMDHGHPHDWLYEPGMIDRLIAKAGQGCRIRIPISHRDRILYPLFDVAGIELRESTGGHTVHRGDDHALTSISLFIDTDGGPILIRAHRELAPTAFARLAEHYEDCWETADPVPSIAEIEEYLEWEMDDPADPDPPDEDPADDDQWAPAPQTPAPDPASAPLDPPARRRWPGRPSSHEPSDS